MNDLTQYIKSTAAGEWVVSSRDIAMVFDRPHDSVMRDIRILDCNPEFHMVNFKMVRHPGHQYRLPASYDITYEGMMLLMEGDILTTQ